MCGRFVITLPPEAMARMFDAVPGAGLPPGPNYNVCPTQTVPVMVSLRGARRLGPMRWGFIPRWYKTPTDGPLLFNARSETLAEKPAFRDAARTRRCLIPAAGFYEWTPGVTPRQPWFIRRADGAPMVFAGVWQMWQDPAHGTGADAETETGPGGTAVRLATCAIVTAAAQGEMAGLHDRVPVVLDPADWPLWLGEAGHGAARLMRPPPDGALRFHRVGRAVNSNRAEGPDLIAPEPD
jgi:putative SOS response-associated peptidase YedK